MSEPILNSRLFQNPIGRVPIVHRDGHGKNLPVDRAMPYFMAAFALAFERAAIGKQYRAQGGIVALRHYITR